MFIYHVDIWNKGKFIQALSFIIEGAQQFVSGKGHFLKAVDTIGNYSK